MTSTSAPKKGRRRGTWIIAACAGCAVVGGVIGGVIASTIDSDSSSSAATASATIPGHNASTGSGQPAGAVCQTTQVAKDVLPSVVTISAKGASSGGTGSGEV